MKIQLYKFRYAIFYTSFNMQIKKYTLTLISCKIKTKMYYTDWLDMFNMSKQKL